MNEPIESTSGPFTPASEEEVRRDLEQRDPPRCNQCGRQQPTHARDCKVTLSRHPHVATGSVAAALGELAAMGSDVCALLSAVQGGATLVLTGPDLIGRKGAPDYAASLESATGAREAHASGNDLPRLLADLVRLWSSPESQRNRVSPSASR